MAFFGTIIGAYEIYTCTTSECLRGIWKRAGEVPLQRIRVGVCIYTGGLGLLLVWTVQNPVSIVTIPALLGGVFTCGLWCFAVLWAERRFLPKAHCMKKGLFVATVIAGVAMTFFGAMALYPPLRRRLRLCSGIRERLLFFDVMRNMEREKYASRNRGTHVPVVCYCSRESICGRVSEGERYEQISVAELACVHGRA